MDGRAIGGSRMNSKCCMCMHKDNCKNKRLEAFNHMQPIGKVTSKIESPNGITIKVNINDNIDINKITEQLKKLNCWI